MTTDVREKPEVAAYVNQVIERWRGGDPPSAREAVESRADLPFDDSQVLDLIYEEFCLRVDAGEACDASTFCEQFPTLRAPISDMLAVHEAIDSDEEIAETLVPAPIQWPRPGDEYRGYQILRCLGTGALAKVYLARHRDLGERHVALKLSRDVKEAATAGRLDHPNVMDVLWVEQDEARKGTWMCMPFCGSATLRTVIERCFRKSQNGPPQRAASILSIARSGNAATFATEVREPDPCFNDGDYVEGCLTIGAKLADALQHAHDRAILHRDLKPSNVLLTVSGEPKLLDFNLSADPNVEVHRSGGTLGYMAPEHINLVFGFAAGDSHVDCRSEVFSLGVILYELLTGQLPFGRPDPDESPWAAASAMVKTQQDHTPRRPSELNPAIDEPLNEILLKCLEFNPMQRFESARELAAALNTLREQIRKRAEQMALRPRRNLQFVAGIFVGVILFGLVTARRDAVHWTHEDDSSVSVVAFDEGDAKRVVDAINRIPEGLRTVQDLELLAYTRAFHYDYAGAAAVYRRLNVLYPDNVAYLNNWAFCIRSSNPQKAYDLLFRARMLEPENPQVLRNFPHVMLTRHLNADIETDPEEVLAMVKHALQHGETVDYVHAAGAFYAAQVNDSQLAYEYARKAISNGAYPGEFVTAHYELCLTPRQRAELNGMSKQPLNGAADLLIAPRPVAFKPRGA